MPAADIVIFMPANQKAVSPGLLALIERMRQSKQVSVHAEDAERRTISRLEFEAAPPGALFSDLIAALALDTTPANLALWRTEKRGPSWVKIGRAVKYRKADLLAFIEESANA